MKARSIDDYLQLGIVVKNRTNFKRRLIKEGYLDVSKCSICDMKSHWNGQPLKLVLDHINGNSEDNRLNNLRLICHNCDSQTSYFCGKNKHRIKNLHGENKSQKRKLSCNGAELEVICAYHYKDTNQIEGRFQGSAEEIKKMFGTHCMEMFCIKVGDETEQRVSYIELEKIFRQAMGNLGECKCVEVFNGDKKLIFRAALSDENIAVYVTSGCPFLDKPDFQNYLRCCDSDGDIELVLSQHNELYH